jgi:UDP-glucose 4-epimerase
MTILVTGGAGYIGGHAAHRLVELGEEVVVFDNLSTGRAEFVPAGARLIEGDLRDHSALEALFRSEAIDTVMHFAASISVPESIANPELYYDNNVVGTLNLARHAGPAGVSRLVFSSTAAVYGECDGAPVREDCPLNPISPYGVSKAFCERILLDIANRRDMGLVALRYFNVAGVNPAYGVGPSAVDTTHLIRVAARTALGARSGMSVFGTDYPTRDGTCVRDFIHVADLVDAHISALRYLRSGGVSTTVNCGYGTGYSVREVLDVVRSVSGVDFEVTDAPRRDGDAAQVIADNSRLKAGFDWIPERNTLEIIVKDALAWEAQLLRDA